MKTNNTLPILLKDQKILLIGGGKVALQKAQVLRENNIAFRVIAEEIHPELLALTKHKRAKEIQAKRCRRRTYHH